jgi:hypothetical protein
MDLQKASGISIENLVEFYIVETMGIAVMKFIGESLGPHDVIEHF